MSYSPKIQQLLAQEARPMSQKVADSLAGMFDAGKEIFMPVNYNIFLSLPN